MRFRTSAVLPVAAIVCLLGAARPALAAQVRLFETQSQAGFLAGTLEGVSVDSLGRMELAPRAERVTALDEPFLLSAAVHPDGGWVAGTGNAGKVLRIDRQGKVGELLAAAEPEVFAVWADPDGTVFAGTSPRGKVYRITRGKDGKWTSDVFFEPDETYIWNLARASDGSLLVGTGTQGKLFKVTASGKGDVLYDSDDTHVRSLLSLPGGDVLAGTAGEGLILRVGRDGQARTLHDAAEPEVVALTPGPDGGFYAAVVASEASLVDLSKDQAAAGTKAAEATVTVTVVEEGAAPTGTRRPGAAGPRSQVLSVSQAGVVESLWSFPEETVYDLLWQNDRLWVSTGLEGKLYRWADSQMLLEKDVDERQIVTLLPGTPGPAFGTTNAAALYRITQGTEKTGTYTSAALDAGQVSRFGTFHWRGDAPGKGAVRFSFRSGVSSEPDRTWSAWTEPREGEGPEVSLEGVPRGRYVQWRAELRSANGRSPRIWGAELSYRQENLKPRIDQIAALEPGQILVAANFNPSNQVYEPAHPNREGIFTPVGQPSDEEGGNRTKPLWKQGFRTVRWTAADPNTDQLVYDLAFRPADSADDAWLSVAEELKEEWYSFDATVLPDGVYRFRVRASDRLSNEAESAQTAERISDPVVIDHAPPRLGEVRRDGGRLRVTVSDAASPLREAMVSFDAQEWTRVEVADGLLDGRTESLVVAAEDDTKKGGGGLVLLRVTDAAFNVVTFNLSRQAQGR